MGRIERPVRWARSFLQLTWVEQRELIVVTCLAMWCEALVRWQPLPELARRFKVGLGSSGPTLEAKPLESLPPWAVMRLRTVRRVMRNWPVEGTCLRHTLVAGHRVSALNPTLHIGVAMSDPGVLEAHAWLEIGGRSLDVESRNYERLSLS